VSEGDPQALLNATLVERIDLNPWLQICRVRRDGDVGGLSFEPGQFTNLGLPPRDPAHASGSSGLVKRPYSIASAPDEDSVEFFVRLVDDGAFTPLLWRLGVGDRLWMDDKAVGKFTLAAVPEGKDLVMVSTGTGIAPFVSMLRHYGRHSPRRWRRFIMINGVRIATDLGYQKELEALVLDDPDFRYVPLCSREPEGAWPGMRGHVMKALDPEFYEKAVGAPLDPEHTQVFLCGNPAMIESVEAHLAGFGFRPHSRKNPGHVNKERYW
jgi:ferredoxin/flavodoxin---NADP+ reductase